MAEQKREKENNGIRNRRPRTATSTSAFGVARREGHDSSRFYARFNPPEISNDEQIVRWMPPNPFICGDSCNMDEIPDNSVALVVTSPPYYVGKEYEQAIGEGHVPATYLDYLDMLFRVFEQCKRKLEPGGRIAVNVANLGRKPYRSLSADVIHILQDELKFLMRGEVIWQKSDGLSSSCAWGSFRKATNPVLRDTTERVIIASKGRFDRGIPIKKRKELDFPHESTASSDEFMEATLDVWRIPPESATRVGHPAPFPVELPQRLIELYTFKGDLVLDPFMGSGSALVAAAQTGRRYVGYDTDPTYVEIARNRVKTEGTPPDQPEQMPAASTASSPPLELPLAPENESYQARASRVGRSVQGIAESVIARSGFRITAKNQPMAGLGIEVNFIAKDKKGQDWYFDVSGAFTTPRAGLLRTDTLWKALGRLLVLQTKYKRPIVLLTTHLPQGKSAGDTALHAVGCDRVFDAIEMLSHAGPERLRKYATGEYQKPLDGFWTPTELNSAKDKTAP